MTKEGMSDKFEELNFPTYNEEFWKGVTLAQDRLIKKYMQSEKWKKEVEEWRKKLNCQT